MRRAVRRGANWKKVLLALWCTWAVLNVFFNSSAWWWNFFMLVPPPFIALVSIAALVLATTVKQKQYLVFAFIAAVIAIPFYKLDISFFSAEARANAVKMVVWNTMVWHSNEGRERFIAELKAQNADIYLLQEAFDDKLQFVDAKADLAAEFSDYKIEQTGDLVTLSKFPIKNTVKGIGHRLWGGFLRTDMEIEGKVISLYNIHLPIPFQPGKLLAAEGWSEMETLFKEKQRIWKSLNADIDKNTHLKIVGGDFNSTEMDFSLFGLRNDGRFAQMSNSGILPSTFTHLELLKFWRIDWVFASKAIKGRQIEQRNLPEASDHDMLVLLWQL
jgi:endonuclease/exonuclease/phosphatase (EEP) superfamily protein YafD